MVRKRASIPGRGDIAWVDLNPTRGHEQRGKRPVLVVSPKSYNGTVGLAFVCPITSNIKGYPFEVPIRAKGVRGVVLVDHLRSIDWKERRIKKIGAASEADVALVQDLLKKLILE